MDIESINNQIQAENDSYNRDKDRLERELLNLKQRHQRRISGFRQQKEQVKSLNTNEKLTVLQTSSENIFKCINENLKMFL